MVQRWLVNASYEFEATRASDFKPWLNYCKLLLSHRSTRRLEHSRSLEAEPRLGALSWSADDDVVRELDLHHFRALLYPHGKAPVGVTGCRIAAGVIMGEDE